MFGNSETSSSGSYHWNSRDEWSLMSTNIADVTRTPIKNYLDFMTLLDQLDIPGPSLVLPDRISLGSGTQFSVFKYSVMTSDFNGEQKRDKSHHHKPNTQYYSAAVKRARFPLPMTGRVDLISDPGAKRQLRNMHLEILALGHKKLRRHRNIVKLLSWSRDLNDWHFTPMLVLELALDNLASFLERIDSDGNQNILSWGLKHMLCLDIAAGLDALHENGIVHGDLKTQNVLVFNDDSQAGYVAKLADFGLAVAETGEDNEHADDIGGTEGWWAPEVQQYLANGVTKIKSTLLPKTDCYSLGLVIFSTMFLLGRAVTDSCSPKIRAQVQTKLDVIQKSTDIPHPLSAALRTALDLLLQQDAVERPTPASHLLNDDSATYHSWLSQYSSTLVPEPTYKDPFHKTTPYDWEFRELSSYHDAEIVFGFKTEPSSVPASILFCCFLGKTAEWNGVSRGSNHGNDPPEFFIEFLVSAATRGFEPAQEVILNVFNYLGRELPKDRIVPWLQSAVATGSQLAASHLKTLDSAAYLCAADIFRCRGGYNMFYSPIDVEAYRNVSRGGPAIKKDLTLALDEDTLIHCAAGLGDMANLRQLLAVQDLGHIDALNRRNETALYKACMSGAHEAVLMLLNHGANPSIPTKTNLTCLHWSFAFPTSHIEEVVQALAAHGADVNAITPEATPYYHFPYLFPAGTPLHWAVTMSNSVAIKALIMHGAEPMLRNRDDPYVFDEEVRSLLMFGGPEQEPYSVTGEPVMGMSALDLSVQCREPFLLQHMVEIGLSSTVDVNAVDEEGYSALHHLCSGRIRRTRSSSAFWTTVFEGNRAQQHNRVHETVKALAQLGGDLDKITNPKDPLQPGRTPLMLAARAGDSIALEALLENGCNPNATNEENENAWHVLRYSCPDEDRTKIIDLLLQYGTDIRCKGNNGCTPLLCAALRGDLCLVEMLLSCGADILDRLPASVSEHGRTWAALLCRIGMPEQMPNPEDWDIRVTSTILNQIDPPDHSVVRNKVIHDADCEGGSLLHYAAREGMPELVKGLLLRGAKPNSLRRKEKGITYKDGVRESIRYTTTPLDEALERKKAEERYKSRTSEAGSQSRCYAGPERITGGNFINLGFYARMNRYERVVELLQNAGGDLSPDSTTE